VKQIKIAFTSTMIKAIIFDAYGTLLDVYSVGALAEQLFPTQGAALSLLWRDKQIDYTRLVTTSNDGAHYQDFWALTRAGLRYACKRLGLALSAEKEAALMQQYLKLTPFPENLAVLTDLKARGIKTAILSNGSPMMLNAVVAHAGLQPLLDHVLSVDALRQYKTSPKAYALGEEAMGYAAADMLFVSSNAWDALAATWFGYQTFWVNRGNLPFETLGTEPTFQGSSLTDVLAVL
jgi:2-haloacid dehalogenase